MVCMQKSIKKDSHPNQGLFEIVRTVHARPTHHNPPPLLLLLLLIIIIIIVIIIHPEPCPHPIPYPLSRFRLIAFPSDLANHNLHLFVSVVVASSQVAEEIKLAGPEGSLSVSWLTSRRPIQRSLGMCSKAGPR